MFVGLLSDTHGVFSKEFADFLAPVDVIWHAGDWGGSLGFMQQIRDLGKPIVGVYGNCDGLDIRQEFPEYQFFREEGLGILLTHIGGSPGHYYPRAQELIRACKPDIFVCGHSHILRVEWDNGRSVGYPAPAPEGGAHKPGFLYMNPGAAGLQGWQVVRTALRFKLGPAPASPAPASASPASASPAGSSTPSAVVDRISELEVFNLPRS